MQQKFEPKDFSKILQGLKSSLQMVVKIIDTDLTTLDQNTLYTPQEKTASLKRRLACQKAAQRLVDDAGNLADQMFNYEACDKYGKKIENFLSGHLSDKSVREFSYNESIQNLLNIFQKQIQVLKDMPQSPRSANVSIIKEAEEILDASALSRKSSISSISPSTSFEGSPTSSMLHSSSNSSSRRSSISSSSSSSGPVFEIPVNSSTLSTPSTSPIKSSTSPSFYKGWFKPIKNLVGYGSPSKEETLPIKETVLTKAAPNAGTPAVLLEEEFVIDNVHDSLKKILTDILQEIQGVNDNSHRLLEINMELGVPVNEFNANAKNIITTIEAMLSKLDHTKMYDLCRDIKTFATKFQPQFPSLSVVKGSMLTRLENALQSEESIEEEFDIVKKTTVYNAKIDEDEVVVKNLGSIDIFDSVEESEEQEFVNQNTGSIYEERITFFYNTSGKKVILENNTSVQGAEDIASKTSSKK